MLTPSAWAGLPDIRTCSVPKQAADLHEEGATEGQGLSVCSSQGSEQCREECVLYKDVREGGRDVRMESDT